MKKTILLLGGNEGDVKSSFKNSILQLSKFGKIVNLSKIYETQPWGFLTKDKFLNQAIVFETELTPLDLLFSINQIEENLGRIRNEEQWTSRNIDIDILFYNDEIISHQKLIVPHMLIQDRKFVLVPLCEIIPEYIHPIFNKTMLELLQECSDNLEVIIFENN
jgi:2-amino-4-hydroxy-6-hydroxymethyldihydropteridine diphosphokinase